MKQAKKLSFYEVNPRYFKDYSGNGIGDLIGLANKFDYFNHINVNAIILQDILSTDSSKEKSKSFTTVASDLGDINGVVKIISLAKKAKNKILIELNIGSVAENHNWFKSAKDQEVQDYKEVIDFKPKKVHDSIKYKYSSENKKYYAIDSNTQEVQLNWGNEQVIDNFMKVIRFWIDLGIGGFVFKNFEYVAEEDEKIAMSKKSLKELRKFYRAIKEINDNVLVIGKTDFLPLPMASHYTEGATKVFDYFLSTEISKIGLHTKFQQDAIGRFSPRALAKTFKDYAYSSTNIVSLNSSSLGKVISRWLNDMQFIRESAKTLGTLLILNKASSAIYFGDEIGNPNIGLTHLDNFQDRTLEKRKSISLQSKLSEKEFMEAQVVQGAINARALMAWSSEKNGGFSVAEKTITPVSSRYKEINVTNQFKNPSSVLNFYAQLNKIAHNSSYSSILANGEQKISTPMIGVIKNRIVYDTKELIIFANLTNSKKSIFLRPKSGKVILSSYDVRDYKEVPKTLDAYETIVISKRTDEYVRETQMVKLEELKAKESAKKEEQLAQEAEAREQEAQARAAEKTKLMELQAKEEQKEQTRLIKLKEKEAKAKEKERLAKEAEKTKLMELKAQEKADKQHQKEAAKEARELEKTKQIELKTQEAAALKAQQEEEAKKLEKERAKEAERQAKEAEKTRQMELKAQEKAEKEKQKEEARQARELEKTRQIELKAQEAAALKEQQENEAKEKERQAKEAEKTRQMELKAQEKADKQKQKEEARQARELEKTKQIELKAQEAAALKEQEKQANNVEEVVEERKSEEEQNKTDDSLFENKTSEFENTKEEDVLEEDKPKDGIFQKEEKLNEWLEFNTQESMIENQFEDIKKENEVEPEAKDNEDLTKKAKKRKEKNIDDGNMFDFEEDLNDLSIKEDAHELKVEDMSSEQKSEIDIAKENAKLEKDVEDTYKDEATKLKEEEIAKTTLVDDSFDIDELFGDEDKEKDK